MRNHLTMWLVPAHSLLAAAAPPHWSASLGRVTVVDVCASASVASSDELAFLSQFFVASMLEMEWHPVAIREVANLKHAFGRHPLAHRLDGCPA